MTTQAARLPNTAQAKGIVTLIVIIAIAVLVFVFAKDIAKIFGGLFKGTSEGLGLSNSSDKTNVNNQYSGGSSPLFSYSFDQMAKQAPAGSPLLTVAQVHDLINKLESYRGILFDDGEKAVGLFASLGTQYKVAWFAKRFQIENGSDLFTWLRKSDTLFSQGFSASIVNDIINVVSKLPVYK
jgi:hypothetical protein